MPSVSYSQLLRQNRNFRLLWGGQIVSQLGDWFSVITLQALLLKYTGQATSLSWLMVATMLPGVLLGPVAGVVVDRLPRKTVMVGADLVRMAIALGLLAFRGPETAWVAYLCMAGLSSLAAFFEPARISTLPNVTSEDELVTANALSSVTWSLLLTSGALLGGLVSTFFGRDVSFILNSFSFLGSALLLARMHVPPTERHAESDRGGALLAGFRYVRAHPEVRRALSAKLGWGLAGGIQVLVSVYGARVFALPGDRDGQLGISILFAAGGLGTALGPIVGRRFTGANVPRLRWAIALAFLLGGLFYVGMAGATSLAGVAALLCLARFHGAIVWVFSTVLLQILTADAYRGRVFAAETSLFTAAMIVSSLATTEALDRLHTPVPQVAMALGAMSLCAGALWTLSLFRSGVALPVPATAAVAEEGPA